MKMAEFKKIEVGNLVRWKKYPEMTFIVENKINDVSNEKYHVNVKSTYGEDATITYNNYKQFDLYKVIN